MLAPSAAVLLCHGAFPAVTLLHAGQRAATPGRAASLVRDAALAKRCSRGWDGRCCDCWGRLHQITAIICWEGGEERLHVSGTLRRRSDASGDTAAPLLRHPAVRICRPAAGPAALGCRAQQPASLPLPRSPRLTLQPPGFRHHSSPCACAAAPRGPSTAAARPDEQPTAFGKDSSQ